MVEGEEHYTAALATYPEITHEMISRLALSTRSKRSLHAKRLSRCLVLSGLSAVTVGPTGTAATHADAVNFTCRKW